MNNSAAKSSIKNKSNKKRKRQHGSNTTQKKQPLNKRQRHPLIEAIINHDQEKVVDSIDSECNLNCRDGSSRKTPLMLAIEHGMLEAAKLLIYSGADVNAIAANNNTALMQAIQHKHVEIAGLLIMFGADIEARRVSGISVLFLTIRHQYQALAIKIVKLGAKLNYADGHGWTPLLYAICNQFVPLAKEMIFRGANVNARDKWRNTPLHWAVRKKATSLIPFLLNYGADINAEDGEGNLVIVWLAYIGTFNSVKVLVSAMAKKQIDYQYIIEQVTQGLQGIYYANTPDQTENFQEITGWLNNEGKEVVMKNYTLLEQAKIQSLDKFQKLVETKNIWQPILYIENYHLLRYSQRMGNWQKRNFILDKLYEFRKSPAPLSAEDAEMHSILSLRHHARKDFFSLVMGFRNYQYTKNAVRKIPLDIVIYGIIPYFRQGAGLTDVVATRFIMQVLKAHHSSSNRQQSNQRPSLSSDSRTLYSNSPSSDNENQTKSKTQFLPNF